MNFMKNIFFLLVLGLFCGKTIAQIDSDSLQQAIRLLDTIHATRAYQKYVDQKIFDYTYGCRDTTARRNKILSKELVTGLVKLKSYNRNFPNYDSLEKALFQELQKEIYPDKIGSEPIFYTQNQNLLLFGDMIDFFVIDILHQNLIYFEEHSTTHFIQEHLHFVKNDTFLIKTLYPYHTIGYYYSYNIVYYAQGELFFPIIQLLHERNPTIPFPTDEEKELDFINANVQVSDDLLVRYTFDYYIKNHVLLSGSFRTKLIWDDQFKILRFAENPLANPDDYDTMTAKIVALNESNISLFSYAFYQEIREILTNPKTHELRKTLLMRHLLYIQKYHVDFLKNEK